MLILVGVHIFGVGLTISHIQTLAIPRDEEVKQEEGLSKSSESKILTEILNHSKETPNFFFSYYNNWVYKIGIGINSSEDINNRSEFETKRLLVAFTNPLIKMKWFYLKKFDKTVAIFIDTKGTILWGYLHEDKVILVYQRADLIDEEIIKTAVVNITIDYMGNGNFKIIVWGESMQIIEYNLNLMFESEKSVIFQEATEISCIGEIFSLPTQFIYKLMFIPSQGASIFLERKEIYVYSHSSCSLFAYELKRISLRAYFSQFCKYDNEFKTLSLVVSSGEKGAICQYSIVNFLVTEMKSQHSLQLVPLSKVGIHQSIMSCQTDLLSVEYLFSKGNICPFTSIETNTIQEAMLVTKSGIYFVTFESRPKPRFEMTKDRAEFYTKYREKKLK